MKRYCQTLAVLLALAPHSGRACEKGFLEWHGSRGTVCLPVPMVAYLNCLEETGSGRLSIDKDDSGSSSQMISVGASGEGNGLIAKGKVQIQVNKNNSEIAVNKIIQKFAPENSAYCFAAAFGKASAAKDTAKVSTKGNSETSKNPGAASPKVVHDLRPRPGEQRRCEIQSQSSCELVVRAGTDGAEETYEFKSNMPRRKIKKARLSFSALIEDEPANKWQPNITNYWLQLTINGTKLRRVFKLEGLERGYPKNQQFDPGSFKTFYEELDWSEFDLIKPDSNTIRYQIGGAPVGGWMLFGWSELRVEYE